MKKLLGKKFPIKDIDGNIIATRRIRGVAAIENYSGILISLRSATPDQWLLITYKNAEECIEGKYDSYPELVYE
jgi:hypothetical protein